MRVRTVFREEWYICCTRVVIVNKRENLNELRIIYTLLRDIVWHFHWLNNACNIYQCMLKKGTEVMVLSDRTWFSRHNLVNYLLTIYIQTWFYLVTLFYYATERLDLCRLNDAESSFPSLLPTRVFTSLQESRVKTRSYSLIWELSYYFCTRVHTPNLFDFEFYPTLRHS